MNDDLISRKDIKDHISELMLVYKGVELNNAIFNAIDNAPTVDTYTEDDVKCAIKEGHQVGYEMAKAKFERPQGKWIKEPNGKTTDLYKCSVCKRSIMLCKGADLTKYPFCHCGADMRGISNDTN